MAVTSDILLIWYRKNARILPWRITPKEAELGKKPDPYKVWISEIMLQQTTVKTVIPYFENFIKKWSCVEELGRASEQEILAFWAGLGYYARGRNLLKCAKELIIKFDGQIPNNKKELLSLPGIGDYTASAIRAIAFGEREIVIDGNVERVVSRLYKNESPIKKSKKKIREYAFQLFPKVFSGDFAQALMDFANLICKPKNPNCIICPISASCLSYKIGVVKNIPTKVTKQKKPLKKGFVFFVRAGFNKFLIERRPSKGMLGGLLGFPTTNWDEKKNAPSFPFKAKRNFTNEDVKHQFSHFDLELEIVMGDIEKRYSHKDQYKIVNINNFDIKILPTLMRKVFRKATKL